MPGSPPGFRQRSQEICPWKSLLLRQAVSSSEPSSPPGEAAIRKALEVPLLPALQPLEHAVLSRSRQLRGLFLESSADLGKPGVPGARPRLADERRVVR